MKFQQITKKIQSAEPKNKTMTAEFIIFFSSHSSMNDILEFTSAVLSFSYFWILHELYFTLYILKDIY